MAYKFDTRKTGNANSGGWRFGDQPGLNIEDMYKPEGYNGGLLDILGNPKRPKPLQEAQVATNIIQNGLLGKSSDGGHDNGNDRTGGLAGNGTNFTDKQWSSIKAMNDEFGFFGNPVNKIGLSALTSLVSPLAGVAMKANNPFTAQQRSEQAIEDFEKGVGWNTYGVQDPTAGSSFADMGPAPNTGMSVADQYASYGAGRAEAQPSVSSGLGSMPSQSPDANTAAQNAAMAESLSNAGYYSGPSGGSVEGNDARNGGNFGGTGSGTNGGRVICTHFYRKGELSRDDWRADLEYTFKNLSPATVRGYQYWAIPYVKLMRKSKLAESIMRPLAIARAKELSYKMGKRDKGSLAGKVIRMTLEPVCFAIGLCVGEQDWQQLYKEA